jgi:hypothetical protein
MWIEAEPKRDLSEVWVYLTPTEGRELLDALLYWAEERPPDPGWHTHITDAGRELTVAISPDVATESFASRFAKPS